MAVQFSGDRVPAARPWVSSGAVFFDAEGRVLLVNPTYKDHWNLPGGGVDAGETPRAACAREVREELGLSPVIGPLRVVAWTSATGDGKLFFVFDGGVLDRARQAAITLDRRELHGFAFVTEAESRTMLAGWQSRLLAEVFQACADGTTRYAELDIAERSGSVPQPG
ncbi:NUDIX domain-containing protein [Planosporangium sp. 12N6]|uniref:NUDIX domain-containing protein n=1 Tax=Planosporangium spinosum TaxID=3402278 RepID=UPI003CE87879